MTNLVQDTLVLQLHAHDRRRNRRCCNGNQGCVGKVLAPVIGAAGLASAAAAFVAVGIIPVG